MKLPRMRFTVRRMTIAVAIVATLIGSAVWLDRRSRAFRRMADDHAAEVVWFFPAPGAEPEEPIISSARDRWHADLVKKYRRAARYPWLPIESDLPEPK